MKKILVLFCTATLIVACSNKVIPLKGNYFIPPYETVTERSFNETWDKLIDLFAQRGFAIRIIDRTSGLIISDRARLPVSTEKKDGTLYHPNAFIAIPLTYNAARNKYIGIGAGDEVTGEWNVRIKDLNGKRVINVNIVNVKSVFTDAHGFQSSYEMRNYKSTGEFERIISDLIK